MSAQEKDIIVEHNTGGEKIVTDKDLKLSLYEFAEKHKLGELNFKLTAIFWILTGIAGLIGTSFWFTMSKLIEISAK